MTKVLLIDDDDTDAFMIQKSLKDHMKDATCVRAATLTKAEQIIREQGADVILLDLRMPDSTGPEDTCDRIRRVAGNIPIVISSNMNDHDLAMSLVHDGAEDFLNKQHIAEKPEHIRDAIEFAIERHNALLKVITEKESAVKDSAQKDAVLNCFMGGYSVTGNGKEGQ